MHTTSPGALAPVSQARSSALGILLSAVLLGGCSEVAESGAEAGDAGAGVAHAAPADDQSKEPSSRARPHVLLISLDTLRADRLGCYGYERPTSPVIDQLAAESVVFEDASAPSSKTATSHMSMFSGLHPGAHGVRNTYGEVGLAANAELELLPESFRKAGYMTAGFTGGGMLTRELGFGRGFDVYDDQGGGADRVFARTKAYLDQLLPVIDDDERLFLFVHTYEIHDPYTPPLEWQAKFCAADYSGGIDSTRVEYPEDAAETWKHDPEFYASLQRRFWDNFNGESADDMRQLSDLYDAGIAYTDALLGELFAQLQSSSIADDLLIVLTSDHGEEFGEHGNVSHQTVYQEILHVPLIVRLPNSDPRGPDSAGRRVRRPVQGADLAPSLLELCGLEPLNGVQGNSWVAPLLGELDYWPVAWAELGTPDNELATLRWNNYKLIGHREHAQTAQFFDLKVDGGERFSRLDDFEEVAVHMSGLMFDQDAKNRAILESFPPAEVELGADAMGAMIALGYVDGVEVPDDAEDAAAVVDEE